MDAVGALRPVADLYRLLRAGLHGERQDRGDDATASFGQVIIGTLCGLLDGTVGGVAVAWLYNQEAYRHPYLRPRDPAHVGKSEWHPRPPHGSGRREN